MTHEPGLWPQLKRLLGVRLTPKNASITDRNVARTGLALILSGLGGLALVFTYGQPRVWSVAITAVLVAGAALGAGFLLGFLFGIPRSRRGEAPAPTSTSATAPTTSATITSGVPNPESRDTTTTTTATAASSTARLTVNANLEEISDWLTKIIVGIGLIELNNIPGNLDRLARYVAAGLVPTPTSQPPVAFALAMIVYFSVLGFLSGYLLTRLFLAGAFSAADDLLDRLREDLERKTEEVGRQKELVNHVIEGADQSARRKETGMVPSVQAPAAADQHESSPSDRLAALEERYKSIRATQPPGEARTRQMTAVVNELGALAPQLKDFDVVAALRSPQREVRLAAYAVIYAAPKPEYLEPLVDSLINYSAETRTDLDNRPFGEYWAIQALDKVLAVSRMPVNPDVVRTLVAWASRLPKGTDRWFEMVKIFKRYGVPAQL